MRYAIAAGVVLLVGCAHRQPPQGLPLCYDQGIMELAKGLGECRWVKRCAGGRCCATCRVR